MLAGGVNPRRGRSRKTLLPHKEKPRRGERKKRMSYTSLHYHIVFSTKERRPYLDPNGEERLNAYLGGIIRNMKAKLHIVNNTADHVHMAVGLHPQLSISSFVAKIKANSSKWIHETFESLQAFSWQEGYSAFSVSYSGMDKVIEYIKNQQEHHKKLSFEEELLILLKKHNIDYDPKYVFK